MKTLENEVETTRCESCECEIEDTTFSNNRKYCSDACRQRAYRQRQQLERKQLHDQIMNLMRIQERFED